jgi:hypothetical protein
LRWYIAEVLLQAFPAEAAQTPVHTPPTMDQDNRLLRWRCWSSSRWGRGLVAKFVGFEVTKEDMRQVLVRAEASAAAHVLNLGGEDAVRLVGAVIPADLESFLPASRRGGRDGNLV